MFLSSYSFSQVADFNANIVSGCPPLIVQFNDLSTGSPVDWHWNFGNGNTSTEQNPSAIYNNPGTYTVSLTVTGGSTKTKNAYITVFEYPTVDFMASPLNGCNPLEVSFTDNSSAGSGALASWEWVFGDGNTSSGQNPTHLYADQGDYSVTLTITNDKGCESVKSKSNLISIAKILADYEVDQSEFCAAPAEVNFNNKSEGPGLLSYIWDFGDGSNSNEINPKHTFTEPGKYNVSLKVISDHCDNQPIYETSISVGSDLIPSFSISNEVTCVYETVLFTSDENSEINLRKWDFGGGNLIVSNDTSHIFTVSGTYDVTLIAEYKSGCTGYNTKQVTVLDSPVPGFTYSQNCETTISFTNTSQNSNSWYWDFRDGNTSYEKNPTHSYSDLGTYIVKLVASNAGCDITNYFPVSVQKSINADFSPNQIASCDNSQQTLGGCAPHEIIFEDKSSSLTDITQRTWDFGDGVTSTLENPSHTYNNAGEYVTKLTVQSSNGCSDTKEVQVVITGQKPVASFDLDVSTACVFEPIKLNNLSSEGVDLWCWDFGDGYSLTSSTPSVFHVYDSVGTFDISLSVSQKGCHSDSTFTITNAITILDPKPRFEIEKNCSDPYTISVINNTENADSFVWDFGDGTLSTDTNPGPHTYAKTGNYSISLKAINNSTHCEPAISMGLSIYDVQADFETDNQNICKNSQVNFTSLSTDAVSWLWNFGDSNSYQNSVENPNNISYASPGKYSVSLIVKDPDGCQDVIEKTDYITVANIDGDYTKTSENFCDQLSVDFMDQSVASPEIKEWFWNFGDGTTSTEQNPTHAYTEDGQYDVSLSVTNDEGQCNILKSSFVIFTKPIAAFSTSDTKYCVDETILFSNNSENAVSYEWNFGNGITSTSANPIYNYSEKGDYTISLVAKDKDGCANELIEDNYLKIKKPTADFIAQKVSAECPPLITTFVNNSSDDVINWKWEFDNNVFSDSENPTYTYIIPGTYNVSLIVTDEIGCKDSLKIENLINLGGPYGSYTTELNGCINQGVLFKANATNTETYIWDFGDGNVKYTKSDNISHLYKNPGSFQSTLVVEDAFGCQVAVQYEEEITIYELPEISFSLLPLYAFNNEEIHIEHELIEGGNWIWDMGDGTIINGPNPTHTYLSGGEFTIKLFFTSPDGCSIEIEKSVNIQEDIYTIPNVFTPNASDDINETFEIYGLEKGVWNIEIFNRWGNKVYKEDGYKGNWDARGLPVGVYYYNLFNAYRSDKNYHGFVTVLR